MTICPRCGRGTNKLKTDIDLAREQGKAEAQKETSEKVRELESWINNCTSQQGKYFMSLGIDMLNEKIKEIFGGKTA